MGKGDKKSKRGKIVIGSSGKRRPRRKKASIVAPEVMKEEVDKKKAEASEISDVKAKAAKTKKKAEAGENPVS
jgi:30S ribosomal protein S31